MSGIITIKSNKPNEEKESRFHAPTEIWDEKLMIDSNVPAF
jgi:hypothetical protein